MSQTALHRIIATGIADLPPESLREIVDFMLLVRVRTLHKKTFEQQVLANLIAEELAALNKAETATIAAEIPQPEKADIATASSVPVQVAKRIPKFGSAKGMFVMAPDFDEPLEDFKDYM